MKKIDDYRDHASECRSMANRARSPEDKAMLLNMAATWESLAVDRLAHIDRLARIEKLEKRVAASIPLTSQPRQHPAHLRAVPLADASGGGNATGV
jgi:hypothetical protein